MKRTIALFVAVIMVVALFAGCGAKSAEAPKADVSTDSTAAANTEPAENKLSGKIVFATNRTDKADNTLKDLAKEFMDKNPDTTIEFEGIKDPVNVIQVRMASDEIPDICLVLGSVVNADLPKFFAPLDDLGYTKDNLYFYDKGVVDGKLYKMSSDVNYDGVIYNKKAFKDAGIDKVPSTIEEFYAACEKLKAKGIVPVASNFKDGWPLQWWTWSAYPYEATGNADIKNELIKTDAFISGPILDGLDMLRTMKEKGYFEKDLMSTNWDQSKKDFAQGKIAMAYLGTWFPPQVIENGCNAEDLGMFPGPGTKAIDATYSWFYAVSANSKSLPLAKAFMKYCWDDGRYAKSTGVISSLKSAGSGSVFADELLSSNLPVVELTQVEDDVNAVLNKAQIDLGTKVPQDYITAKDPKSVVDNYNKKINEAKKALGK